ncbi:MAG: metal ABC transporter substrate-binding protein [Dehalococcoidia bacterium]|nr:metal ABC transporter substrate-binding protein [Dehalococcoidia bacterium]
MRKIVAIALILPVVLGASCVRPPPSDKPSIVVTYSLLGSLVKELVGEQARVTVSVPNGLDPHEWSPSARDIEAINHADLVVQNGLGLEEGMLKALEQAKKNGVRIFTASDYIEVRHIGEGELAEHEEEDEHEHGHEHGHEHEHEHGHEHKAGAADPHLWTDPLAMKQVVAALAEYLKTNLGIDVDAASLQLQSRLEALNEQIHEIVSQVPGDSRKLVTGHESMGYFASRYGFQLIGAVIPSLSNQASVSAADMAVLKQLIIRHDVKVIFAETGTPPAVAQAIAAETGAQVVEVTTHGLPADGSYFTFASNLAHTVANALK